MEAARAGEQGKGFSVVAEEVGNFASMSGTAAKEITELLDKSLDKVESIVTNTKSKVESLVAVGKEKVDQGIEVAQQCQSVLEEIVVNISSVAQRAGEISTASEEQYQGIKEINAAVSQLDQVTQQNATSTEKTAKVVEILKGQAGGLNTAADDLNSINFGQTSSLTMVDHHPEDSHPPGEVSKTASGLKIKAA